MKRVLTIGAVTALTIAVSVPAAALPTLSQGPSTVAATNVEPQVFVAAGAVAATPVVRDAFSVETIVQQVQTAAASYSGTLAMWPASAPVNDGFGYRGEEFHKGIDIMAPGGSVFVAASPGIVTKVAWDGGWGQYIVVDHGGGIETLYSHAIEGSPMVSVGQAVAAGTPLALVGQTGYATVQHLHFEVHVFGAAVDPLPWLP